MLTGLKAHKARPQTDVSVDPFDRWVTPQGDIAAQFYRRGGERFLVRFPEQADFEIDLAAMVHGYPVPGTSNETLETLYRNSILPIIGNHQGGLNLHGSAVATPHGALAFLGVSRRGKTTLAGAFAAAGYPFLTEDAIALEHCDGTYMVQPKRPVLRVFRDSASFLLGGKPGWDDDDIKSEVDASTLLPCADAAAPLRHIFILGAGEEETVSLHRLGEVEALSHVMQQAFVLDVEDKPRLRAHFGRVASLAAKVSCHALDYPRRYDQLPRVIEEVAALIARDGD